MAMENPSQAKPDSAAASARVTPEELARALARIEAREAEKTREAEQSRHQEATIPLGQAVEELGLRATPEDIFAEIEAQRGQEARLVAEQPTETLLPSAAQASASSSPATPALKQGLVMDVSHCPACGRKLLTRASALCSWCGERIDNSEYQTQAEAQRQALDQIERTQVESMAQEEAKYGVFGRLKRRAKQSPGPTKPGLG